MKIKTIYRSILLSTFIICAVVSILTALDVSIALLSKLTFLIGGFHVSSIYGTTEQLFKQPPPYDETDEFISKINEITFIRNMFCAFLVTAWIVFGTPSLSIWYMVGGIAIRFIPLEYLVTNNFMKAIIRYLILASVIVITISA